MAKDAQRRWRVGKYIRLSREDGTSESVVNQEKILDDEIPCFFEPDSYEVVDAYIDDGTSGTTDAERLEFQRMTRDVKAGRINCIVVKNLSRAFRNSANQGRFLEEFIPLYRTRFISLYQPRLDTYLDPEVVHSLEVGVTGFLNEQYAYKTSVDVRRTFRCKREKGEFIGAFAPYGYAKDPRDKNRLVIDEEAAAVVRDVFRWFLRDGMSKRAIALRLNELAVPNPTAYKRAGGLRYRNPNGAKSDGLWCARTVGAMLTDPIYAGVMRQGRQKVVSYKLHKRLAVPESEWVTVEGAAPAVVSREEFERARELLSRRARTAPGARAPHPFSGLLRCADCGAAMRRGSAGKYVYYACRTHDERDRSRCARHTIRGDALESAVLASLRLLASFAGAAARAGGEAESADASRRWALLRDGARELERLRERRDELYEDWKRGDVERGQYRRLDEAYRLRAERLEAAARRLDAEERAAREAPSPLPGEETVPELSRALLRCLVRAVRVREGGAIEIELACADPFASALNGACAKRKAAVGPT